jgi:hypothetical protein
MSPRFFAAIAAISACTLSFAAAAGPSVVEFHESRPLAKLIGQLWDSHNFLITYEEAPYDEDTELFTDIYKNGVHFRYPAWRPVSFHIPQRSPEADQTSTSQGKAAPTAESVAESAVAEYNASGNPGRFQAVRSGDYVHIVPAGRMRNGRLENFEPILDTKVTFLDESRSCLDTINDLVAQIGNLRGAHIAPNVPLGPSIRYPCRIVGTDLTAREALTQYLEQIAAGQRMQRYRYVWTMTYEVNTNTYFLIFYLVETNPPTPPPHPPAPRPTIDSVPPPIGGALLIGVPAQLAPKEAPAVPAPAIPAKGPQ